MLFEKCSNACKLEKSVVFSGGNFLDALEIFQAI